MPIYHYRCEACEHDLEALQKVSDAPLVECPQCGEERLRKQLTAAGFRLKGSGWYETDFKGKKSSKDKDGESSSDTKKTVSKADKNTSSKGKPEKTSNAKTSQAGASNG